MSSAPVSPATVLAMLAETPRRLAAVASGFDPVRLNRKPAPDSWSANEVLAHLRSCADVWGRSILAMIARDHPTLRYVSPRSHIRKTDYLTLDFAASVRAFATQRDDLLSALKPLRVSEWSRGAVFTGTIRGREQTVASYARRLADHEWHHLDQIGRALGLPKLS